MAVREIVSERARRQKWLTGAVAAGLSITAIAVAVTYLGRANRRTGPVHPPPSPAAGVNQQLSGYTFTRSDDNRPVFTIHAARTVSYQKDKSTILEDVTVEVFDRKKTGNSNILRTERCEYNPQSGDFLAGGPVEMELNAHSSSIPGTGHGGQQRVYLETSKVSYHQNDQTAETDQPVKFHVANASGTAVGMTYAIRDGWLVLKHQVAADLVQASGKTSRVPIHLAASELRYDKDAGLIGLAGPVEVNQGNQRGLSDNAKIELDDRNRVSRVNLEGHARAFETSPLRSVTLNARQARGDFDAATGQLRHLSAQGDVAGESRSRGSVSRLSAQSLEMDLEGKPSQPLRGVAKGNVRIGLESQPVLKVPESADPGKGPEKKDLKADTVRFAFRPETHGLKSAETVGSGTLTVSPSDPKSGEKVITAGQFLMVFDARSRLESLRGTAPTEVQFRPAATAPSGTNTQVSKADRLDAEFDPRTQTLHDVTQSGDFRYRDGDRQGSSDEAHYDPETQTMVLEGHPQVWDSSSRTRAQHMSVDMRTNTATGEGRVQASHLRSPAPGTPAPSTPSTPLNVLADKMVAERQSQTVRYEGHVRAWQGTDIVESSSLDVNRTLKRVSSGQHVVTSFLQPAAMVNRPADAKHDAGAVSSPVTVRADFLEYFDQGRRARYNGNVRLVTQNTTMQSDHLDVYFTEGGTPEGSEVDRAEADGRVRVTQPGRVGTGNHGEYFAGPGKIILTGGPPVLVDEERGSTTGQRLTFFVHDDRLVVDGGDQSPSLSRHRVAP